MTTRASHRSTVDRRASRARAREARAFTVVELLVSVAAASVLMSLALFGVSRVMVSAREFKCAVTLRSVVFDFSLFADDSLHGNRGRDRVELPEGRFRLETFQESEYGLDEFWRYGDEPRAELPTADGDNPLRCAEVRGDLWLVRDTPCSQGAIDPPQGVSYTFNYRLQRAEVMQNGRPRSKPVTLSNRILAHGDVPLVWDVDGAEAARRELSPVFSAPAAGSQSVYANDQFWFPALRHAGKLNVAFVDGHVASASKPLAEGWRWDFQPVD